MRPLDPSDPESFRPRITAIVCLVVEHCGVSTPSFPM